MAIRWTLLLFVATIPFETIGFFSGSLSPARIAGLLFFAACCFHANKCFSPPGAAVCGFVGYLLVYVLNGPLVSENMMSQFVEQLKTTIQLILLLWLASRLLRETKLARSVLITFSLSSVVLSLATLVSLPGFSKAMVTRETQAGMRVTTLGYNPNDLSAVMALATVMLLGLRLSKSKFGPWQKIALLILTFPLLALLVRTGSRMGIAAFVIGVLPFLTPLVRGDRQKMLAIFLAVFGLVVVGVMLAENPVILARWSATYNQGDTAGRGSIYGAAFDMFLERPTFGWRPIEFLYELGRRAEGWWRQRDAHDLLLYLLLEVGLVGTIPFLFGLWLCVLSAWRGRNGDFGILPLALMLIILAVNISTTWLGRKPMWLVMAVAVAVGSNNKWRHREFLSERGASPHTPFHP